uniref:Glycosyltransferase n=1 Tax=Kalanchoe fedtschenkoi TaxID=63787 RepID=A0A7N0UE99_KALFE
MTGRHHFLLLTYPIHSHTNPALRLASRLIRLGVRVSLATNSSACSRLISTTPPHEDLTFVEFPDNYARGLFADGEEEDPVQLEIRRSCSETLSRVISTSRADGCPITCLVYTPTLPWVMGVAHELPVPSCMLWIQPATVLVIFYWFFFGYGDAIMEMFGKSSDCSTLSSIQLPGLPLPLKASDLPTFMRPENPHPWGMKLFEKQTKWIAAQEKPYVLVNTFESLEPEALKAVKELNLIPIGPLIPPQLVNGEDSSVADGPAEDQDHVRWLNSKPNASVVYVSFGSVWNFASEQTEELARALLQAGRPFLWVIKAPAPQEEEQKKKDAQISRMAELEQLGLIVPWCNQVAVLSHPSVGCFVTHCGWNSMLESLAAGVPMVGMPIWVEQTTNAKLVEDYWKSGVRARANEKDLVETDEIRRCVDLVMADETLRLNARKWRGLAVEAAKGDGPADDNLRQFLSELDASL